MYREEPPFSNPSSPELITSPSTEEAASPSDLPNSPETPHHSSTSTPEAYKTSAWELPQTPPTNADTCQQHLPQLDSQAPHGQLGPTYYLDGISAEEYPPSVYYTETAQLPYDNTLTATPQSHPVLSYALAPVESFPMQSGEGYTPCIDPHLENLALQATLDVPTNQQSQLFYQQTMYSAPPAPQQSIVSIGTHQLQATPRYDVVTQPISPILHGDPSPRVSPQPALNSQSRHHDQRAFPCLFEFAGCSPTKPLHSKNEWKRHLWAFHFQEFYWVCNNERTTAHGRRLCNTVFNRKDSIKHHHSKSCLKHEYKNCTDKRQLERYIDNAKVDRPEYHSPEELHCLFNNCRHQVSGDRPVNDFLEHLWTHLTIGEDLAFAYTNAWTIFVNWTITIGTLTVDMAGHFWAMPPVPTTHQTKKVQRESLTAFHGVS